MYTGILLRGEPFNAIYLDPPIAREAVVAGEHMGIATNTGVVYWLNVAALATIGLINDDQGNSIAGISTSALPIQYSGTGYIKEESDHMLIGGAYKLNHVNTDFMTSFKPTIVSLTVADINVTYTSGTKAVVFNETTREELGVITTSGTTFTFGVAQTVGDVISVKGLDASYNLSAATAAIIA